MSATLTYPRSGTPAVRDAQRPGPLRLLKVELRKMVDTRAGFWLPVGVAALTVAVVLITVFAGSEQGRTLHHVFHNAVMPSEFLLPVAGVLLVTGEFSQRTALTTFTLVPDRRKVLLAKLAAALVVSVIATGFCLLVALAGTALHAAPGSAHPWSLHAVLIPQAFVYLASAMVTGIGFGAAVLISAPAIVAYLLLPTVWDALLGTIKSLDGVARWLDQARTMEPLVAGGASATDWAHALTTMAVWMVAPLLIGTWRMLHRSVD